MSRAIMPLNGKCPCLACQYGGLKNIPKQPTAAYIPRVDCHKVAGQKPKIRERAKGVLNRLRIRIPRRKGGQKGER